MQYFYLRREPEAFYLQWITHLNSTGEFRSMIFGFMNSMAVVFASVSDKKTFSETKTKVVSFLLEAVRFASWKSRRACFSG